MPEESVPGGVAVCGTNIVSLHKHKPQHPHNASMLTQPPRTPARFAKSSVGAKQPFAFALVYNSCISLIASLASAVLC